MPYSVKKLTLQPRATFVLASLCCAALLGGCESSQAPAPVIALSADTPVTDKGVIAFRDICLASAPSFDKAWDLAKKFGVKPDADLGGEKMALAADNSLSVQVKPGTECATTTPSRQGTDAIAQFLGVVAKATGTPIASLAGKPFLKTTYRGKTFLFRPDRSGGEAYVMLSGD